MKKKNAYILIGLILVILFLHNSNLLIITDISGYTRMNFNDITGLGVIVQGQTSAPIVYNGNTWTVSTVKVGSGLAAVRYYKNGNPIVTIQSPAPNCPPCSDYYPEAGKVETNVLGNILCYTATTDSPNYKIGDIVCYSSIFFCNSPTSCSATCSYNGQTYNEGQQIKMVNGCYSTTTGQSCSTNYQFSTCFGGKIQGGSLCYPGEGCGLPSPTPTPTPTCTSGQVSTCTTDKACAGLQTCSNNVWGACIPNDINCGQTWLIPEWVYYLLIGAGILLILYGMMKK